MRELSDEYIISQVLGGDTGRYALLVDRHKNMVFTLAFRITGKREDAEEIAQDAFVKAFNNLKSFKGESKFSSWIYRITYNTAVSAMRKKVFYSENIENSESIKKMNTGETVEEIIQRKERQEIILTAVNRLPDDEKTILTLFYQEDCPVEEISDMVSS